MEKLSIQNNPSTSTQGEPSTSNKWNEEQAKRRYWRYSASHPKELIIGDQHASIQT